MNANTFGTLYKKESNKWMNGDLKRNKHFDQILFIWKYAWNDRLTHAHIHCLIHIPRAPVLIFIIITQNMCVANLTTTKLIRDLQCACIETAAKHKKRLYVCVLHSGYHERNSNYRTHPTANKKLLRAWIIAVNIYWSFFLFFNRIVSFSFRDKKEMQKNFFERTFLKHPSPTT